MAPAGALLAVFGAGGHAACVAAAARASGWEIAYFIDEFNPGGTLMGAPIIASPDDDPRAPSHVSIGVGDNWQRACVAARWAEQRPSTELAIVVDPRATVDPNVDVGAGAVVLAGAIVGLRSSLGPLSLVCHGSVVTHDCALATAASIGPGAIVSGGATVGARTVIGAGAVIREKTTLGDDTVVGAAAFVGRDLPDRVTAYGVPARIVAQRDPGDPYLR